MNMNSLNDLVARSVDASMQARVIEMAIELDAATGGCLHEAKRMSAECCEYDDSVEARILNILVHSMHA